MPHQESHASPAARRRADLWNQRLAIEAIRSLPRRESRGLTLRERALDAAAWGFAWGLRLSGLYAVGRRNANALQLTHLDVAFPDLPAALDGLRLLHITDPHFGDLRGFNEALCKRAAEAPCDLCVLTGDFRFERSGQLEDVRAGLEALTGAIRSANGVYAVLGNHDESSFVPVLEAFGVRMLLNRHVVIPCHGAAVCLAGVDDPHMFRCADVAAAVDGAPPDAFRILLAHSPEIIAEAAAHGIRLYLCGHTHAGQIRVPGVGAVVLNTRAERRHAQGRWRADAMEGYTSPGAGTTDLPVRFNCPPEITLLRLVRR